MKTQRVTLPIDDLGCSSDAPGVERTLVRTRGVVRAYVNPATEMAYVEYDPDLVDPDEISRALRESSGGAAPRRGRADQGGGQPPVIVLQRLDAGRLALAAGSWAAAIFALCIAADLVFPNLFRMYRLWELLLIGFDWTNRWTAPLGLVEAFVFGAFGAWTFAAVYNRLPPRLASYEL